LVLGSTFPTVLGITEREAVGSWVSHGAGAEVLML